jgi:SAM-dependent methyltransferase
MLYDDPVLYDALMTPGEHAPYYCALAARTGGPVLELACGSGQLIVPVARAGLDAAGLDLSPAMLGAARLKARAAAVTVELVEGDMRAFDLGRRFALVFIARNSMLHLASRDDFAGLFAAVKRHLLPGGVFAFDVFNPGPKILARPPGVRFPVMTVTSAAHGGELVVEETYAYDSATQVSCSTWLISAPGRKDAWVAPLHLRSIFPQELPLLLASGGLELVTRAGGFGGEPFTSRSEHQVCTARVA